MSTRPRAPSAAASMSRAPPATRRSGFAVGHDSAVVDITGDTYASAVLADTPLVYLRLADTRDHAGNLGSGTAVGGVTLGAPSLLSNDADAAAMFDGSTGYVSFVDDPRLRLTSAVHARSVDRTDVIRSRHRRTVPAHPPQRVPRKHGLRTHVRAERHGQRRFHSRRDGRWLGRRAQRGDAALTRPGSPRRCDLGRNDPARVCRRRDRRGRRGWSCIRDLSCRSARAARVSPPNCPVAARPRGGLRRRCSGAPWWSCCS